MHRETKEHLDTICKDAGLGSMAEVMEIVIDRDCISEESILNMTETDITTFYEDWVEPTIDRIENELIDREKHFVPANS